MKCEFAKTNPLIIKQAVEFYLKNKKGLFTFVSLWNDEEPFPKDELLICLDVWIKQLKELHSTAPTIETELTLKNLLEKRRKLK
ncbi:TPA: hypothetical protein ACU21B_000574 [Mannheimia haemolytica]